MNTITLKGASHGKSSKLFSQWQARKDMFWHVSEIESSTPLFQYPPAAVKIRIPRAQSRICEKSFTLVKYTEK